MWLKLWVPTFFNDCLGNNNSLIYILVVFFFSFFSPTALEILSLISGKTKGKIFLWFLVWE